MKRTLTRILLASALGGLALGASTLVGAYPTTSPSAKQAVRLKYHPPANWLRHYLGDDRYKIDGNVWKVVSTQLDTYYHRPNCPNMLRQPAGIVIGFPSAAAAQEGGYKPDPVCHPEAVDVTYAGGASGEVSEQRVVTTVNLGKKAQRITLADGRSTVLLPPNWKRTQSGASTIAGQSALSDTLQPLKGKGSIRFSFVPAPANLPVDPSQVFRPATFSAAFSRFNTGGQGGQSVQKIVNNLLVGNGQLGKIKGVTLTAKRGTVVPGVSGRAVVAATKNKIYVMDDTAAGAPGAQTIVNSFQPR
jgi:hypothetical protein